MIVCAEEPTRMVDWNDRSTCVLFGDGAGAVVVSKGGEECTIKTNTVSKPEVLYYRGALQPTPFQGEEECTALKMNGQEVFKYAVSSSLHDIQSLLRSRNIDKENVKYYLLHQANVRIIDAIHHYMKVDECKFPRNIAKYGNTSSASIPILLDEVNKEGKLKRGDLIVMSAFGAGFVSGACILEW